MNLFDKTRLGTVELKNRIFRSATNEYLAWEDGSITEDLLRVYEDLAAGGVGTVITGHYAVEYGSRVGIGQCLLPVQSDEKLREAAERVHRYGSRLIMQISHGGPKAAPEVNRRPNMLPQDFDREQLAELRDAFVRGALRARKAGFDGVQVHLAHGYLLSAFLDPFQNLRTDEYGNGADPETASPEELLAGTDGRFRICGEIIEEIRRSCGENFLILVKVNADASRDMDYVPILHRVLELCRERGVDAAEISGLAFSRQRADRDEPYFLKEAVKAGEGVALPLILVGGLDSRRKMETVLEAGIPYVSLCRSLICQPDFAARLEAGAETSPCLRCFGCFRVYKTKHVRCVLHKEPIPTMERMYRSV